MAAGGRAYEAVAWIGASGDEGKRNEEVGAPARTRPVASATASALLVAALLAVAAGVSWAKGPAWRAGLRRGVTVLRRTEEAERGTGANPLCSSLPTFQRYANADTLGDVKCSCPEGQAKRLCEKGTRSQNACCGQGDEAGEMEDALTALGKAVQDAEEKTRSCVPSGQNCTVMLTFKESTSVAEIETLAAKYEPEAKPSVLAAARIASLAFGAHVASCCKALAQLRAEPLVAAAQLREGVLAAAFVQRGFEPSAASPQFREGLHAASELVA